MDGNGAALLVASHNHVPCHRERVVCLDDVVVSVDGSARVRVVNR